MMPCVIIYFTFHIVTIWNTYVLALPYNNPLLCSKFILTLNTENLNRLVSLYGTVHILHHKLIGGQGKQIMKFIFGKKKHLTKFDKEKLFIKFRVFPITFYSGRLYNFQTIKHKQYSKRKWNIRHLNALSYNKTE